MSILPAELDCYLARSAGRAATFAHFTPAIDLTAPAPDALPAPAPGMLFPDPPARRDELQPAAVAPAPAAEFPQRFPGVCIFKPTARRRPSDPWLIEYKDPEKNRRVRKSISYVNDVTAREAKRVSEWLERCKASARLSASHQTRPLLGAWERGQYVAGHLDDYRAWLLVKGRTSKQVGQVAMRARKMIRVCRWRTIGDVKAEALELAVGRFLRDGRELALKTCNDYLKSPAQFVAWMALPKIGRAATNSLAGVEKYNADTDPRRERRPLTAEQLLAVIETTLRRPTIGRMSGEDRAAYYLLKVHSGFRNPEMRALTPESFDLDCDPPTLTCPAAKSKHRRRDVQTLAPALLDYLREWLATKPAGAALFAVNDKPWLMWRADLTAAGISYRDAQGRYADLYALRHTFATELGRIAPARTVQRLLRHGDLKTSQRYIHPDRADDVRALAALPLPLTPIGPALPPPPLLLVAASTRAGAA